MWFPRSKRSDIWYTLLLVGIGGAIAAWVAATLAIRFYMQRLDNLPPDMIMLYLAAPLAALLIGPALWWRFLISVDKLSIKRGVLIGLVGSILVHPLTWFFALIFSSLAGMRTIAGGFILENPFTHPLELFAGSFVYAFFSLLIVGWITVLIGGLLGGLIASLQIRNNCQQRWNAALS